MLQLQGLKIRHPNMKVLVYIQHSSPKYKIAPRLTTLIFRPTEHIAYLRLYWCPYHSLQLLGPDIGV